MADPVNEHAHRVLDVIARPAGAPANEHSLAALLQYWRAAEFAAGYSWAAEVAFVNAASGITNNFGDSWHKYWDDQDV